jgi:hypothetical protein
MASLNVTVTLLVISTPTAPFVGRLDVTVGGVMSAVVKVEDSGVASEFPARSRAPAVTMNVYPVEPDSGADGVNVAVFVMAL